MKVRSSVKRMCKECKVTKYNQKVYIRCKANPRHKQRQLFSTLKMWDNSYLWGIQYLQQSALRLSTDIVVPSETAKTHYLTYN